MHLWTAKTGCEQCNYCSSAFAPKWPQKQSQSASWVFKNFMGGMPSDPPNLACLCLYTYTPDNHGYGPDHALQKRLQRVVVTRANTNDWTLRASTLSRLTRLLPSPWPRATSSTDDTVRIHARARAVRLDSTDHAKYIVCRSTRAMPGRPAPAGATDAR